MKNIRIEQEYTGRGGDFDTLIKVADNTYITPAPPYPSEGIFLLDENANVLDKDAESYPAGTIKAYGFRAGDGNYYAVDAEEISGSLMWGGYNKLIESLPSITTGPEDAKKDYNGEHNTIEIIKALDDYNDGYTTGAPAAEACRAKILNGKQGFLPTLGQLWDFWTYESEVNTLATKFFLDIFQTEFNYWTSTQYSATKSWSLLLRFSISYYEIRRNGYKVRAFFAL